MHLEKIDFNLIEKIKNFVEESCMSSSNKYGYDAFKFHFTSVVNYAEKLSEKFNADKEVVLIASWLHDIGSVVYGRENHHITGAEIAEKKLKELNYSEGKINLVKKCILNHRGSITCVRKTIEEKIVFEADALSHFDNIPGLFSAAFSEGKNQFEAGSSVKKKLINKYNQLSDTSKKLVKNKYLSAMVLLEGY